MKLINTTQFKLINKKASDESDEPSIAINDVSFESRTIDFRADINELSAGFLIKALTFLDSQNNKPIKLNFSSPGGDVISGLAVYDTIRSLKSPVEIYACGKVMSMGFIIFLAADYRDSSPNTSFMMHSILYAIPDDRSVKSHEAEVIESKRLNQLLINIMGERTKKPKSWWYRKIQSSVDCYLTRDEAVEYGIVRAKPKGVKKVNGKKKATKKR